MYHPLRTANTLSSYSVRNLSDKIISTGVSVYSSDKKMGFYMIQILRIITANINKEMPMSI